jgi:hypothetical protein
MNPSRKYGQHFFDFQFSGGIYCLPWTLEGIFHPYLMNRGELKSNKGTE